MGTDIKDLDLQIIVEMVDGGFIVHIPSVTKANDVETGFRYKRTVVTSPRKALALVKDAMNEFKLSDTDEE